MRDRDESLIEVCRGQLVAHIGCVDSPLAEDRLASGDHLHSKVLKVSKRVIGVDIDEAGLLALEARCGGEYLCQDLSDIESDKWSLPAKIFGFEPDVYLVGDVVEHLANPIPLLTSIARLSSGSTAKIVVTTPNALAARGFLNTALGYEMMHPDHLLVHSPTTLSRLIALSGLKVDQWNYYSVTTGRNIVHRLYDAPCRLAARVRPAWADGLLVTCSSVSA